jgi:hypothetical protein
VIEDFLTLYADPGEDFGWAVGCGTRLLTRGITKMWTFADEIGMDILDGEESIMRLNEYARNGVDMAEYKDHKFGRIVAENWRIYPKELRDGSLEWDECRTARVIGAMTFIARRAEIPFITQPAAIKPAAEAAGAHELYDHPLYENRHSNDAIQHFVYFTNTELMGLFLPTADTKTKWEINREAE